MHYQIDVAWRAGCPQVGGSMRLASGPMRFSPTLTLDVAEAFNKASVGSDCAAARRRLADLALAKHGRR